MAALNSKSLIIDQAVEDHLNRFVFESESDLDQLRENIEERYAKVREKAFAIDLNRIMPQKSDIPIILPNCLENHLEGVEEELEMCHRLGIATANFLLATSFPRVGARMKEEMERILSDPKNFVLACHDCNMDYFDFGELRLMFDLSIGATAGNFGKVQLAAQSAKMFLKYVLSNYECKHMKPFHIRKMIKALEPHC